MSGSPGIVTPSPAGRRLLSPLSSAKGRNTAELLSPSNDGVLKENLDTTNLDGSKPSTISMPRIDSCILGKETLEERDKFTVSEKMGYFNIVINQCDQACVEKKNYSLENSDDEYKL